MGKGKISDKQTEILEYIKEEQLKKGYPPSVREICKAVGLKSTSSVHAHLASLEENGYIRRDPTKPRAIEIIDDDFALSRREVINIPVVGQVAAGLPILATQNMSSFKSKGFDFYANAQYPLIMKQQTIDDKVIKDLYGVSGQELQEVRTAIAGLQKGELIIKDQMAFALGMGKKYKKINVTHLI